MIVIFGNIKNTNDVKENKCFTIEKSLKLKIKGLHGHLYAVVCVE